MEDLLVSLLMDLHRRCDFLCARLRDLEAPDRANDLALAAYRTAAGVRQELADVLADPTIRDDFFRVDYYRRFRRWTERVLLVEPPALPSLERFNDADDRLCTFADR